MPRVNNQFSVSERVQQIEQKSSLVGKSEKRKVQTTQSEKTISEAAIYTKDKTFSNPTQAATERKILLSEKKQKVEQLFAQRGKKLESLKPELEATTQALVKLRQLKNRADFKLNVLKFLGSAFDGIATLVRWLTRSKKELPGERFQNLYKKLDVRCSKLGEDCVRLQKRVENLENFSPVEQISILKECKVLNQALMATTKALTCGVRSTEHHLRSLEGEANTQATRRKARQGKSDVTLKKALRNPLQTKGLEKTLSNSRKEKTEQKQTIIQSSRHEPASPEVVDGMLSKYGIKLETGIGGTCYLLVKTLKNLGYSGADCKKILSDKMAGTFLGLTKVIQQKHIEKLDAVLRTQSIPNLEKKVDDWVNAILVLCDKKEPTSREIYQQSKVFNHLSQWFLNNNTVNIHHLLTNKTQRLALISAFKGIESYANSPLKGFNVIALKHVVAQLLPEAPELKRLHDNLQALEVHEFKGDLKLLGGGRFNKVYAFEDQGRKFVFKPISYGVDNALKRIVKEVSDTAVLSGIDVHDLPIARVMDTEYFGRTFFQECPENNPFVPTRLGCINGEFGIVMDFVKGTTPKVSKEEKIELKKAEYPHLFEAYEKGPVSKQQKELFLRELGNCRDLIPTYDATKKLIALHKKEAIFENNLDLNQANIVEDFLRVQLLGLVLGDTDRHTDNFIIANGRIKLIDNDVILGKNALHTRRGHLVKNVRRRQDHTYLGAIPLPKEVIPNKLSLLRNFPPVITKNIRQEFEKFDETSLRNALNYVSEIEKQRACERLRFVKEQIATPQIKVVDDREALLRPENLKKFEPNNSLWAMTKRVLKPKETVKMVGGIKIKQKNKGWNYMRAYKTYGTHPSAV